jgi:hypothetical protein
VRGFGHHVRIDYKLLNHNCLGAFDNIEHFLSSTIDRHIIEKLLFALIRRRPKPRCEFDFPIRKLSPTFDDFEMAILCGSIEDFTNLPARCLQRQGEGLNGEVVFYDSGMPSLMRARMSR